MGTGVRDWVALVDTNPHLAIIRAEISRYLLRVKVLYRSQQTFVGLQSVMIYTKVEREAAREAVARCATSHNVD